MEDEPDFEQMIETAQARGAPNSVAKEYQAASDPAAALNQGVNPWQSLADYSQAVNGGMTSYELGVKGEIAGQADSFELAGILETSPAHRDWSPEKSLTHGELVNSVRPQGISDALNSQRKRMPLKRGALNTGVQAGGKAYPYFIDPKKGRNSDHIRRSQNSVQERRTRVMHIYSLRQTTGIEYSKIAHIYDSTGTYSATLEVIRKSQVQKLQKETGKDMKHCKKVFDYCLGDYKKALRKLELGK